MKGPEVTTVDWGIRFNHYSCAEASKMWLFAALFCILDQKGSSSLIRNDFWQVVVKVTLSPQTECGQTSHQPQQTKLLFSKSVSSWVINQISLTEEARLIPASLLSSPRRSVGGVSFSAARVRHQLHRLPPCCQNSTGIYEQLSGVRLSCVWSHKTWTWLTPRSLGSYHKPSIPEGRRRLM